MELTLLTDSSEASLLAPPADCLPAEGRGRQGRGKAKEKIIFPAEKFRLLNTRSGNFILMKILFPHFNWLQEELSYFNGILNEASEL